MASLGVRGQLYASFATVGLLLTATGLGALAWNHSADMHAQAELALAESATLATQTLRLQMLAMSNAMRGVLLDPTAEEERRRKLAADEAMTGTLDELRTRLAGQEKLIEVVDRISRFDEEKLDRLENRVLDLVGQDRVAAAAFYASDYLPARLEQSALVDELADRVVARRHDIAAAIDADRALRLKVGLALFGLVLGLAFLLAWRLGRSIAGPVLALRGTLDRMAARDLTDAIDHTDRGDEIGAIARAVDGLRDALRHSALLEAAQAQEQAGKEAAGLRMAALMRDFEQGVGQLVGRLGAAASGLTGTAEALSGTAGRTRSQADAAGLSAEAAGSSVQMVAAAVGQLTASIGEINRKVGESTAITARAVADATRTGATVQALAEGAQSIGHVLELIASIAGQTNLLALNATIEAARAGDAGKGFAVVASEVKSLAGQTGRATEEIGAQIASIRRLTHEAVQAIADISATVGEISAIVVTIGAAVEEQSQAAAEIASNVAHSSAGTQQVGVTIGDLRGSVQDTDAAAGRVLQASTEVSTQAARLSAEFGHFAEAVRAG